MNCEHMNFRGEVDVHRLCPTEDTPATRFTTDLRVKCSDCGMPFRFLGSRFGVDPKEPTLSVDSLELRIPMYPNDGATVFPNKLVSRSQEDSAE